MKLRDVPCLLLALPTMLLVVAALWLLLTIADVIDWAYAEFVGRDTPCDYPSDWGSEAA